MKTRVEIIEDAYNALEATYTKAFGDWWLNAAPTTTNWEFIVDEYEGEEFIRTRDGYVEFRFEQVKVIGRNAWKYIVFQVFPDDVGKDFEFYDPHNAANKFMELQLNMKLAA